MSAEEQPKIGLGITTYRRPDYLAEAVRTVDEYLGDQLTLKIIHDDFSPLPREEAEELGEKGWAVILSQENVGVAKAKNRLLSTMMEAGMDYLFLMEDDQVIKSSEALSRYIQAMEATGLHHLMFAHHGPANVGPPVVREGLVEGWPNCVGSFCVYTREAIDTVGYIDEEFGNALDHVNHTYRLSMARMTGPWRCFADVAGSRSLIGEQPGAIENTSITSSRDIFSLDSPFQKSLRHWFRTWPMPSDLMAMLR